MAGSRFDVQHIDLAGTLNPSNRHGACCVHWERFGVLEPLQREFVSSRPVVTMPF